MPIPKILLLTIFATLIVGGALIAQAAFRFDLRFNEIAREARSEGGWGERAQLIPKPFSVNESRIDVLKMLASAGFERVSDDDVWARYHDEVERGREIHTREANDIVCEITIYVFVEFNEAGNLVMAEGTQHEHGCL